MTKIKLPVLLLLIIFFTLQSCEVRVADNRRSVVKGTVLDSEQNPIANIPVRFEANGTVLGESVSDLDGNFLFTTLEMKNSHIQIRVNLKRAPYYYPEHNIPEFLENPLYAGKQYTIYPNTHSAFTYNLGQVQLKKSAQLSILFKNVKNNSDSAFFKLDYQSLICEIDPEEVEERCPTVYEAYQALDVGSEINEVTIYGQKEASVTLKFRKNNGMEQSTLIPLTHEENIYTHEY